MRYFFTLLLLTILPLNFATAKSFEIEVSKISKLILEEAVIIDIRRKEEWEQTGIISGSMLSTFFEKDGTSNIKSFLSELREQVLPDQTILLICRTGRRTKIATEFIISNTEFKKVFSVRGGITEWKSQGFRTVSYP